jgi:gamma-glutamyl-gamma-aminobutyrate hydrolase PuuD
MKKIGLTQRIDEFSTQPALRDEVNQTLHDFIMHSGFEPVPIPNLLFAINSPEQSHRLLNDWLHVLALDGFVLAGSNPLDKQKPKNPLEFAILDYAFDHQLPVLGIEQGMELMALWSDTPLIKDEQQLHVTSCPEHFKVLATLHDESIARIGHERLPWEAWICAPERKDEFLVQDIEQFSQLMSQPNRFAARNTDCVVYPSRNR